MKSIPTQRAAVGVAALEPAEQTGGMKDVLAGRTLLIRGLHVGADDAVADGALGLALQGALDIASESDESVDEAAVAEHDDALDGAEPGLPFRLRDADAGAGGDEGVGEGVVGWKGDAEGDGR